MIRCKFLLMRLGLLILVYSVARALFLAFNFQAFNQVPAREILAAFVFGLRVDIAAICMINIVFAFFSVLPGPFFNSSWYRRFLKFLFLVSNIPFLITNIVDFEYFKFIGERSTLSLLDMKADIGAQLGQLAFHYWYLAVIGGLLVFVLYSFNPERWLTSAATPEKQDFWTWARGLLVVVGVMALVVLGGRGGWQRRPLSPVEVDVFDKSILGQLALNSSLTLIRSQRKCDTGTGSKVHLFPTDEELKKELSPQKLSGHAKSARLDNIVIVIVESLSAEFTGIGDPGHGYTPFLDALAQRGISFKNNFANGRRSIDAPPAILAGLPHLRDETFFCVQSKQLYGIGSLLKERGYTTSFFHGGKNGTMYFDVFSKRMGFDDYYGLNEYPNPADSDGIWGIYDEPFLQFMAQKLTTYREPFASVAFTLSMHNPYKIPPQYQGVFPKGEMPMHESVGYSDHALKAFFETAEKMPWYKNTLFVITGDHTAFGKKSYENPVESYRVPLIFFHPGRKLPTVNPARITQHADIEPSLLDFLGIATDRTLPFGHSIFDPSFDGLALSQTGGTYWIAHKNYYLEYRINGPSRLFDLARLDSPIADKPEVKQSLEKKLKAYIQWFNDGLAKDRLYH